jgi:hypothetical protein
MSETWPQAGLGNVGRLRALAAGFRGAAYAERVLPLPFTRVWDYFSDMERSIPSLDRTVAEFRILTRDGARLTARTRSPWLPLRFTLDVDLDPGWCLMTARPVYYLVAFAAQPQGEDTLFAHAEAANVPGPEPLRRPLRPLLGLSARWLARHVGHDIDGLEAALGLGTEA